MGIVEIVALLALLVALPGSIAATIGIRSRLKKKDIKNIEIAADQNRRVSDTLVVSKDLLNSNNGHHIGLGISERDYSNVLIIGGIKIPYIPLIGSWGKGEGEYRCGDVHSNIVYKPYNVPDDFINNLKLKPEDIQDDIWNNTVEPKVRLVNYSIKINPGRNISDEPTFNFSKIFYRDYLLTNHVLDEKMPYSEITFREKYFQKQMVSDMENSNLSNICGVGVFILTSDNKVILVKTSPNVAVNPNTIAYSASGTMDWNDTKINPFDEIIRECREEINHSINIEDLFLFSFGIDVTKAYYQFSFFERSPKTAEMIIDNATMARDYAAEVSEIFALDFDYKIIIKSLSEQKWDAPPAATILTLCAKYYGKSTIENYLNPKKIYSNYKSEMEREWNERASREGKLAVLSNRFPNKDIDKISEEYIRNVMDFLTDDIVNKTVLEVGCGIGLITKELYKKAKSLICIDISSRMIERNRELLGEAANNINYFNCFFQDFQSNERVDIIISSLVLIHNTHKKAIEEMVAKMRDLSDTIFLFEQIDTGIQVSASTVARAESDYLSYFSGYTVVRRKEYQLSTDKIVFLKLSKRV